jgi:hypothetical protein
MIGVDSTIEVMKHQHGMYAQQQHTCGWVVMLSSRCSKWIWRPLSHPSIVPLIPFLEDWIIGEAFEGWVTHWWSLLHALQGWQHCFLLLQQFTQTTATLLGHRQNIQVQVPR